MKKALHLFLLVFYSLGTFLLPLGDFTLLPELPAMYSHCKAYEDPDMTAFDFISDHLLNIDGIFDAHENGDDQKPHSPLQTERHSQLQITFLTYYTFSSLPVYPITIVKDKASANELPTGYLSNVFRPPIV